MNLDYCSLEEVCAITMGQAPSGDSYNDRAEGLPLIAGAGDFNGERPRAKKFTNSPSKTCMAGDIVLGIRASIGAKVWADRTYCLGRGVAGLRPGAKLHDRYLWHWLTNCTAALVAKGRGATFLQVNRTDISELKIPVLPLDEQRRIAAILDQADALRTKRDHALYYLSNLTQSIFEQMFGAGDFVPVMAGEIMPEMRNGLSPASAGKFPAQVLTLSAVTQGAFNPASVKAGFFTSDPPASKRVSALDFLMCRGNGNKALVGVGVASREDRTDLVFPDTVIAGRVDSSRVGLMFLEEAWKRPFVRRQIEARARTTNGTYKLNQETLSTVRLPLPPIALQQRFGDRVARIEALRAACGAAAAMSDELLHTLQSRAFRGLL